MVCSHVAALWLSSSDRCSMGLQKFECRHGVAQRRCAKCFFDRNGQTLCEEFPWLCVTNNNEDDQFSVGCSVCMKFYQNSGEKRAPSHGGLWTSGQVVRHESMQRRALQTHEDSAAHQKASGNVEPIPESTTAPSPKQFKALLDHCQKHQIGGGLGSVGGQKKCRKMLWCLAESSRERKRQLWLNSSKSQDFVSSTTVFQDARKGRLSVRFTAANSQCERRLGHLGTVNIAEDLSAIGLMDGLSKLLEAFCTPCLFPPHLEKPHAPVLNQELHSALLKSIEAFISDAASDEIRAGHMLAGQSTSSMYAPRLPNLQVVGRDKPHGTRRMLSRGWKADPFLDEVSQWFVFGPSSPTKMIQYSHAFKEIFAANIRRQDPSITPVKCHEHLKDLGFAAHRFESASKPMTRIAVFFQAFLSTVVQVACERKGHEEGKSAIAFLDWLTPEKCLQLAMLADCSLECIALTRMTDYQGFPIEELPAKLLAFRDRIKALFVSTPAACFSTGCTEQMLKSLRRPFVLMYPGPGGRNITKELGCVSGVTDAVAQACLRRMANWVRICEATLDSEFPSFEVLRSFSIFNVRNVSSDALPSSVIRSNCLSRLQKAFMMGDRPEAGHQFERLWHCARRISNEEGVGSAEAWVQAVKHVTRAWSKPDLTELLPILVRFWAAGASTSGVEQAFSRATGLCDNLMVMDHVNDAMEAGQWRL